MGSAVLVSEHRCSSTKNVNVFPSLFWRMKCWIMNLQWSAGGDLLKMIAADMVSGKRTGMIYQPDLGKPQRGRIDDGISNGAFAKVNTITTN
jgi:hypothetical protein